MSVFSESEPGVEGAGVPTPPVQSHLWPAALLGFDPNPHLHGLPGPGFPLSTTTELVRDMDAPLRVSNIDYY